MKYLCKGMILILIINTCVLKTFGDTTFQQTILTTVPGAVNISAINQSLSKGSIAPQTGISTAPSASFNIFNIIGRSGNRREREKYKKNKSS